MRKIKGQTKKKNESKYLFILTIICTLSIKAYGRKKYVSLRKVAGQVGRKIKFSAICLNHSFTCELRRIPIGTIYLVNEY